MNLLKKPFFHFCNYLETPPFLHKHPLFWNFGLSGMFLALFYFLNSPDLIDTLLMSDISIPSLLLVILLFWPLKTFFPYISWVVSLFVPYHVALNVMTIKESYLGEDVGKISLLFQDPFSFRGNLGYFSFIILLVVSFKIMRKFASLKSQEIKFFVPEPPPAFSIILSKNAYLIQGAALLGLLNMLLVFCLTFPIPYSVEQSDRLFQMMGISIIFFPPLLTLFIVNFMMISKMREPNPFLSSHALTNETIAKIGLTLYLLYDGLRIFFLDSSLLIWYFLFMGFFKVGAFFLIVRGIGGSRALHEPQPSANKISSLKRESVD